MYGGLGTEHLLQHQIVKLKVQRTDPINSSRSNFPKQQQLCSIELNVPERETARQSPAKRDGEARGGGGALRATGVHASRKL